MLTVEQVADYFLLQVDEVAGDVMTNLRLQKLVYYAQAWHLAIAEKPLFQDDVEAWVHGPVVPCLYYAYRDYGWQPIPRPDRDAVAMDDQTRELLDEVWDTYGQFSAKALENLTHSEVHRGMRAVVMSRQLCVGRSSHRRRCAYTMPGAAVPLTPPAMIRVNMRTM